MRLVLMNMILLRRLNLLLSHLKESLQKLLKSLSPKMNLLMEILMKTVLNRPKGSFPIYLCPIQSKAQIPYLATLLATQTFLAKGVHGPSETGSNEPQRLFSRSRNKLSRSYQALPIFVFLKTKAYQKILTMAANGASSQLRSEIRIPTRRYDILTFACGYTHRGTTTYNSSPTKASASTFIG